MSWSERWISGRSIIGSGFRRRRVFSRCLACRSRGPTTRCPPDQGVGWPISRERNGTETLHCNLITADGGGQAWLMILTLLLLESVHGLESPVGYAGIANESKPHGLVARFHFWRKFAPTISGQHFGVAIAAVADLNFVVVAIVSSLLDVELVAKFQHNIVASRGCYSFVRSFVRGSFRVCFEFSVDWLVLLLMSISLMQLIYSIPRDSFIRGVGTRQDKNKRAYLDEFAVSFGSAGEWLQRAQCTRSQAGQTTNRLRNLAQLAMEAAH